MTRVRDLIPGDEVTLPPESAVYIAQCEHPIWPRLRLVIWRLRDGSWSHDALLPAQEVGTVTDTTYDERRDRLRHALLASPDEWQGGITTRRPTS